MIRCFNMKKILIIFILLLFTLSSCKKKDDVNSHKTNNECSHENKSWVTIKDSTCLERGSKNQICDDCGIIITTAFISLKDHHEVIDEPRLDYEVSQITAEVEKFNHGLNVVIHIYTEYPYEETLKEELL